MGVGCVMVGCWMCDGSGVVVVPSCKRLASSSSSWSRLASASAANRSSSSLCWRASSSSLCFSASSSRLNVSCGVCVGGCELWSVWAGRCACVCVWGGGGWVGGEG